MDEDQFRSVYNEINAQRCVFEKALNNRRCDCSRKNRFLLATREGVGCYSEEYQQHCTLFLNTLRDGSRFALREITIDGPLPHNKELKVQAGGCLALQALLSPKQDHDTEQNDEDTVADISKLIQQGIEQYDTVGDFPYSELVQGVVKYQSRRKRPRRPTK